MGSFRVRANQVSHRNAGIHRVEDGLVSESGLDSRLRGTSLRHGRIRQVLSVASWIYRIGRMLEHRWGIAVFPTLPLWIADQARDDVTRGVSGRVSWARGVSRPPCGLRVKSAMT